MAYHMAYVQYALTTLVSLNRLTVLFKYNIFEPVNQSTTNSKTQIEFQIWKKITWLFILVAYFVPFLNTHIIFQNKFTIDYLNESDSYTLQTPNMVGGNFYKTKKNKNK